MQVYSNGGADLQLWHEYVPSLDNLSLRISLDTLKYQHKDVFMGAWPPDTQNVF